MPALDFKLRCTATGFAALCMLFSFVQPVAAQAPAASFDDEFSGSSVDASKWMIESYPGHDQGTFRADAAFYKPEAIQVSDQQLHIKMEKVPSVDAKTGNAYPLRSGRMQTKQSFLFGKFEFRAKLPRGAGLWPAIWMRTPYGAPFDGEIDILEGRGSHPNVIQSTMHPWINGVEPRQYCAWLMIEATPDDAVYHKPGCDRLDQAIHLNSDLAADFHVYTIDWLPGSITWSLDGQPYYVVRDKVPQVPMTVVLSMAFSHNWDGGSPATTPLPQSLDLSYVRIHSPNAVSAAVQH